MKNIPALAILAIALALPGRAAPPTTASIDKLLEAAKVAETIRAVSANLDTMIHRTVEQATRSQKLTPADQKVLDAMRAEVMKDVATELNWTEMRSLFIEVYSSTFSQEEIDGLIAFYNTPVGKAFAAKQPEIAQKTNSIVQQRMMPVMARIRASVSGALEQIQAAHDAADAAKPAEPAATAAPAAGPIKINP
jgi:hypothetical protein